MKKTLFFIFLVAVFSNCSGVNVVNRPTEDLYGPTFLHEMDKIKKTYLHGDSAMALKQLSELPDSKLKNLELAYKNNFIGVIHFNLEQYDKAINAFKYSLGLSKEDLTLTSQIYLNLSSSYYRKGQENIARENLSLVNPSYLNESESAKYYKLRYLVFQDSLHESLFSLVKYFGQYKSFSHLKSDDLFPRLATGFYKLDADSRLSFLYQFEGDQSLAAVYLAGIEAEKQYYSGEKGKTQKILSWLNDSFSSYGEEYTSLIDSINFRISNFSKINMSKIGVILPISGNKEKFAQRVLQGLNVLLDQLVFLNGDGTAPEILIRDDKGDGVIGEAMVKELAQESSVPIIIGGLFSEEAAQEYLMAKKLGVLFISLSEVYLPDYEKDFLLIEVPGSVESQVERILSQDVMGRLGNKVAMIHSDDKRGEAYFDRFWKKAKAKNFEIKAVQSYSKNIRDYRDPVRKLLSMDFLREREDEYQVLSRIYSLSDTKSLRRTQTLTPIVDFNWIFAPSYPEEAMNLISTFNYHDAGKLAYIGVPSWRSKSVMKLSSKAPLYFVGPDGHSVQEEFRKLFYEKTKSNPSLLEMLAYSSGQIAVGMLSSRISNRNEFHHHIQGRKVIDVDSEKWVLEENLWIKQLKLLTIKKGQVLPAFDN